MPADSPAGSSETELKFQLGQGALDSLSRHPAFRAPGRRSRLRSIYFDTPEHDLRNSGFSLRVREKDGAFVQTLKSRKGAGVFDRDEWETGVAGDRPDPSVLAETPAGRLLNGALDRLTPVFETSVDRTVHMWSEGGDLIEVALDQGEVIAQDQKAPLQELELELREGAPRALFRLAGELARDAAMTLSFQSKAERGYRLAGHEGAAAILAERAAITGETTAGAAFRQIARDCLVQIAGNAELLRTTRSARLVHQTRVGVRRLRAALSIFRPILDAEGHARAKAESKWLAGELDAARDIDVFADAFFGRPEETAFEDANLAALHQRLLEAQAKAHEQAARAVQSQRFSALLLDLSAWIEAGAWSELKDPDVAKVRAAPISAFGAARLEHMRKSVLKRGRHFKRLDAEGRHQLRLKAKKLRYAAEFFAGAFGGPAARRRRFVEAAKTLQDRLGELNDLAVARETALKIVGPRAGELAFTAGVLVGDRQKAEAALLRRAGAAVATLDAARPFWRKRRR